jgi:hypothetical protein
VWRVLRAGRYFALHAAVALIAAVARADAQGGPGALSEMSVPGGLEAALAAIDDRAAPDRSQFLLEFIRRTYDMPVLARSDPRETARQALLARLDLAGRQETGPATSLHAASSSNGAGGAAAVSPETLPLPLTPALWIAAVFGGRATPQTLLTSIAGSRDASLLYYGLMWLDDETRAWLSTQPQLVTDIAARHATAFAVAAPGLRVSGGAMHVPGGSAAEPAWEALVGRSVRDPGDFTRTLLATGDGRLAYVLGTLAQLTPAQIRFALRLDVSDVPARVAAARRLFAVFDLTAWNVERRVFWRPPLDPALLIADLSVDERGQPILPGTRAFWMAVLSGVDPSSSDNTDAFAAGDGADIGWLCEQIFKGDLGEQRRRSNLVLFASRTVRRITPETARDAVVAVHAAGTYPALVLALERAKLGDLAAFANAARRASRIATIGDGTTASRVHAQFQGVLSLLTRAAIRGRLPPAELARLVSSLSAVEPGKDGEYGGGLLRWLMAYVDSHVRTPALNGGALTVRSPRDGYHDAIVERVAGEMDRAVLRIAAGPVTMPARFVDWEGMRYRLDLASSEATRIARLLGEDHPAYLSAARGLIGIADALAEAGLSRDALRRQSDALAQVAQSVGWEPNGPGASSRSEAPGAYREAASALRRKARDGDVRGAARLAPSLCALADDLLARGLIDVVYAVAMGQPGSSAISAGDAASRHDFAGRRDRRGPWQLPVRGTGLIPGRSWHMVGSLLGLDIALADFSLMRLSSKPPSRKPTMDDVDRQVMTEAVALAEPAALMDPDRDSVVDTLRNGRIRLAAVLTPAEALAIADEIRLAPSRRTLMAWVAAHDPGRLGAFLSPIELFWLGLDAKPVDARLQPWGGPAEPRLGCLCVQMLDRRPWETLAGRWHLGLLASGLSDLNLRLAELLSDLKMPAPLLAPVLAAATVEFIENATSRDPDDRRGPIEFVQALGVDRVEQYLALLTTDGPLVPIAEGAESGVAPGPATSGASR